MTGRDADDALRATDESTAQATFAATLVDEWVRAGVGHAVISPGSRSAPLAVALATRPEIRLHVHVDERSAAFVALGIGRASGVPAIVLTTSGTAAVELHPAMVEADLARVPLVACTANRPPELHGVGAPQTVDQTHLFGRAVRWFSQPGVASYATASSWRSLGARAVAEATGTPPGPVHLDLAFREPLVASAGPLPPGRPRGAPWHRVARPTLVPDSEALEEAAELLAADRGVIVAGAGSGEPAAVHRLARKRRWPVLADPPSGCRIPGGTTVAAFDALLRHRSFTGSHRPEVVLRLGAPPASKVLSEWLVASGARQVVVDAFGGWLDPSRIADLVATGDPAAWCRALADCLVTAPAGNEWLRSWAAAEAAVQKAVTAGVERHRPLSEPGVARALAAAMAPGSSLVVASSMPVRDLEWYAAARTDLRVLANRGANGIDGTVSTAVGVALATGAPTTALVGDLAFLHDANGLLGLAERDVDLTVVVVDNHGGGIFSFLPPAQLLAPDRFELLFGTPHTADLVALASAHGVRARPLVDLGDLAAQVKPGATGGPRVLVATTDRQSNVAVHAEIHAAVGAALERLG